MKCNQDFVYKGLIKVEPGEFVNDKGEKIAYKGSYKLKLDEKTDKGIFERVFKVSEDNNEVIHSCALLSDYDKVNVEFEVQLLSTGVKLVPVEVNLL